MSNGSTVSIVLRVRRDQLGQAAGRDDLRLDAELAADRCDDAVDLAGEAVDEPRLERGRGRLADHRGRLDEVDLDEPRRAREQRLHRDLDPRREHAADVLALRARRRRSSSRCRSRRRCTARRSAPSPRRRSRSGRGRPRAGRRSGSGCRCARPGPSTSSGAFAQRSANASYSRTSAGTVEERQIPSTAPRSTKPREQRAELVAGAVRLGRDAPVLAQLVAVEEPEDGLRVPDVDREQHQPGELGYVVVVGRATRRCARRAPRRVSWAPRPRRAAPRR